MPRAAALAGAALLLVAPLAVPAAPDLATAPPAARANWFDDPFLRATDGLPGCPAPAGPVSTAAEARAQSHGRVERGTSCWREGVCRLPNAYRYDAEIAPRVLRALHAAGRFEDTTVWVTVQQRWVWLQGCVNDAAQAADIERLVRRLEDVEQVVPQLHVGPVPAGEAPPWRTGPPDATR